MFVWGNGGYVGAVWVWCAWCVCGIWHTFVSVCVMHICVCAHACITIKYIHTSMVMYKHKILCYS